MIARLATLAIVALGCAVSAASAAAAGAGQPRQPAGGPGGRASVFAGVRTSQGGRGADAWYVFEPARPAPPSAPLVVVMHGYYEFAGYAQMAALIRHTVLKGNVVIYPRWQTAIATPCPGPFNIEPCIASASSAVHAAIAYLRADRRRVQPRLDQTSYYGFSFGGIITANMTSRYRRLGLPRPRAIWLDDPHDGGLTGNTEPALDASLTGIPSSTTVVCHDGADGVISLTDSAGVSLAGGGCNAVWPKLAQIPAAHKSLVLTSTDTHGTPGLSSAHGVCAGGSTTPFAVDAYDWGFCWRSFDALRACALYRVDCRWALGDTPENRFVGTWSDGVPIVGLKIQTRAPIRRRPVPRRAPAPPRGSTRRAPSITLALPASFARGTPIVVRGNATGANGVAFVEVVVGHAAPVFATGTTRWSLRLGRLAPGTHGVRVRAVDAFGQSRWVRASLRVN